MKVFSLEKLKDPFAPEDIEWRIQSAGVNKDQPWGKALAYVDARAVQDRLDAVCGQGNWKDEYTHLPNGVMCRLSIRVDGEWIAKENGAPETDVEGFKGGISKALVRTASTWGIGRYLYRLETTFVKFTEDRRADGAKWAKIDGKDFYWLAPRLPDWALPEQSKDPKKPDPYVMHPTDNAVYGPPPRKVAAQPPQISLLSVPNAGGRSEAQQKRLLELSHFVMPWGDHKGKKFHELGNPEIEAYCFTVEAEAKKKGKTITGKVKDFMDVAAEYLDLMKV